jgi:hypothetical protein
MRRRLNYANVVATLALVFAMSGGALAAKHYLINSTKQISPKVLKALKGKTGRTGPTGPAGPTGAKGERGEKGEPGKEATVPVASFTALTLIHGWTTFGSGYYGAPSYTKDTEGFVHLSGALDGSNQTAAEFAVLPAGFRPRNEGVWLRAPATNGASDPHLADIEITSAGEMIAYLGEGATGKFVGLEGLSFYAG